MILRLEGINPNHRLLEKQKNAVKSPITLEVLILRKKSRDVSVSAIFNQYTDKV